MMAETRLPVSEFDENLIHDMRFLAKGCVHHRPIEMYRDGTHTGCGLGVQIVAEAIRGNDGSPFGIALRLPCDAVDDPLFSCSQFEARGIDRARDQMIALREAAVRRLARLARRLKREDA